MNQARATKLRRALNAQDRSTSHLALGAAVCVGAVLFSWAIAARNAPAPINPVQFRAYQKLEKPPFQPPGALFGLVWPPLYAALAVAGTRLWNARGGQARDEALRAWAGIVGLITSWMALRQKRGAMLGTALASIGTTASFMRSAYKVDKPAAMLVAPFLAWISFAAVLTGELWRRNRDKPESAHALAGFHDDDVTLPERAIHPTATALLH